MSDRAIAPAFVQIAATPYPWPFDGRWSERDTALLLLGFEQGTVAALGAEAALQVGQRLLALARDSGLLVVAGQRARDTSAPAASRSDGAWADGLDLPEDALIVRFGGDNAFYGTALEARLLGLGIRNLLIAGLPTEGLVHASQRTANDMGFECLTVSDACKGTSIARHEAQLRITTFGNGLFGAIALASDVASALGSA
ncbi:MAG: isochorismatase family cysteine hydrolase [Devosia sp.]